MKKVIKVLVICMILCLFMFSAVACEKENTIHEHDFGEWEILEEATCIEDGIKIRNCSCGEKETKVISAIGHHGGEATCNKKAICEVCFQPYGELDENNHKFSEWILEVPATCTQNGVKAHKTCTGCKKNFDINDKIIDDLTIPATGHNFGSLVDEVEPTCLTDGTKAYYYCDKCDKKYNETKTVILEDLNIPATGHVYGDFISQVDATCTLDGIKAHFHCENCGGDFDNDKCVIKDLKIEATGHNFGNLQAEVKPTCLANGTKAYFYCDRCNKRYDETKTSVIDDITIMSTGHNFGDLQEEVEPTCTENGTRAYYYCDKCEKKYNETKTVILEDVIIQATGHNYGDFISQVDATCTSDGVKAHYHCENCGSNFDSDKRAIEELKIEAAGHNFGSLQAEVKPTCLINGTKAYYYCDKCSKRYDDAKKEILDDITILSTGHNFGDLQVEVEPTCTENGTKAYYYCDKCDKKYNEAKTMILEDASIPATGHKLGDLLSRVEPNCVETGELPHYHCEWCDKDFDENKMLLLDITIPALYPIYGHSYIDDHTWQHVCSRCGDIANVLNVSEDGKTVYGLTEYGKTLSYVAIPEGATTVARSAFFYNDTIESIEIPTTLTTYEYYAFALAHIKNVYIKDLEKFCNSNAGGYNGPMECGAALYLNGVLVEDLVLSDNIKLLRPLNYCTSIKTIVCGNEMTSIETYSFDTIPNLTTVTISSATTSILDYAFYKCEKFEKIIYIGTKEEWNNIQKSGDWYYLMPDNFVIQCTDGILDKDGNDL